MFNGCKTHVFTAPAVVQGRAVRLGIPSTPSGTLQRMPGGTHSPQDTLGCQDHLRASGSTQWLSGGWWQQPAPCFIPNSSEWCEVGEHAGDGGATSWRVLCSRAAWTCTTSWRAQLYCYSPKASAQTSDSIVWLGNLLIITVVTVFNPSCWAGN